MLSAKIYKFFSSLSVRLTFWSVLVFSICLAAVLTAFYYISKNYLFRAVDASVRYELEEALVVYRTKGFQAIPGHINEEAEEYNPARVFYRIIGKNGDIVAASDLSSWHGLPPGSAGDNKFIEEQSSETIKLAGDRDFARLVSIPLSDELYIEGGIKLNNEIEILRLYRWLLPLVGLAIITFAAAAAYAIAGKAMRRVDEMTLLANSISASQLSSRLPVGSYDDELSRLSETFNKLLGRIESLVRGMKNVTDDIAHDLKMPITRMRSRAELALSNSSLAEDPVSEAANTIEECDQLLNLLNSMLDISEAEARVVKLNKENLDLDHLLKTALEFFDPVAEQKGVSVSYESCGQTIIEGDLSKLQRALSNLIDNAIKYTQTGGKVDVFLMKQEDAGILIKVQDSGIGISPEELPLIYERFYRADTSRNGTGNGLGLTMSRAFIYAHGGEISVESEKDSGTCVTVKLYKAMAA